MTRSSRGTLRTYFSWMLCLALLYSVAEVRLHLFQHSHNDCVSDAQACVTDGEEKSLTTPRVNTERCALCAVLISSSQQLEASPSHQLYTELSVTAVIPEYAESVFLSSYDSVFGARGPPA